MDTFTHAYLTAALFTDCPDGFVGAGEFQEADPWTIANLDLESLHTAETDCLRFQTAYADLIADDVEHAGRDFWYTRNGHGCGFWDGDWPEDVGDCLTDAAQQYPQVTLYQGDDGRLYFV